MSRIILSNIARFVFLILLQVLLFNNIYLGGLVHPLVYVIIILSLPIETPPWATLVIGFMTGFSIDVFTHTPGMHTMATTLMAFLRPKTLGLLAPRDGYEFGTKASIQDIGFGRYITYASVLILAHHIFLFALESNTITYLFFTVEKIIVSTISTLLLVILFQYLNPKKQPISG